MEAPVIMVGPDSVEVERRRWDIVLAGITLWLVDWFNEVVNALVLHFTDRAALWTVTGDTIDTRWGPVQVRVTLKSGKITKVETVKVPDGNPRDQEINSFAVPQLNQEALAAQNAKIDTVSGATVTSDGYIRSLQSALDKAGT